MQWHEGDKEGHGEVRSAFRLLVLQGLVIRRNIIPTEVYYSDIKLVAQAARAAEALVHRHTHISRTSAQPVKTPFHPVTTGSGSYPVLNY
jgi:hypothetical protein